MIRTVTVAIIQNHLHVHRRMDRLLLLSQRLNEIDDAIAVNSRRRAQMLQPCDRPVSVAVEESKAMDRHLRKMKKDLIWYTMIYASECEDGDCDHLLDRALTDRPLALDGFKIPEDIAVAILHAR